MDERPQPAAEPNHASERSRRFELLAQGDAVSLHTLAEAILTDSGNELRVLTGPRIGTLMLRLREPVHDEVFNAGEVLVTEAAVALGAHRGFALRLGRAPETALAAAILDAAAEAGHPLNPRIDVLLADISAAITARETETWHEVAPTRAAFEEMH